MRSKIFDWKPEAYLNSNLVDLLIFRGCRNNDVDHFVYASSSSVYGGNINMPFSEKHSVDHPVSLYAANKKSNELIAHSYSHLYEFLQQITFFTVYGPWGRLRYGIIYFY